jgi:KRAB domain-containing zinc finger protein
MNHHRIHTGDKPFIFNICNKGFTEPGPLVKHCHIHTGERPYKCDICGRGFADSSSSVGHKRSHTAEKSFTCYVCYESFSWSGHLITHLCTNTGEKTLVCDICATWFAEPHLIVEHLGLHNGEGPNVIHAIKLFWKWPTCVKDTLLSHHQIHSGVKPFTCEICNRNFSQSSHLLYHRRRHLQGKVLESGTFVWILTRIIIFCFHSHFWTKN